MPAGDPDADLLASGLVEEAEERAIAGTTHRFDAYLLAIAVKKLRLQLAEAEARNRQLVERGRWLVESERRGRGRDRRVS